MTLQGEPVQLRADGTFTVRFSLPDSRQIIPAVAASADGIEERTIVLAVERNTKELEPMIHEINEIWSASRWPSGAGSWTLRGDIGAGVVPPDERLRPGPARTRSIGLERAFSGRLDPRDACVVKSCPSTPRPRRSRAGSSMMPAAGPPRPLPCPRPSRSSIPYHDLEAPMSQDLRPILAGWDFDPDRVQVRIIVGDDGAEKIQMRIDLGLMQMELAGRPDGERPEGFESMLEYYESRQKAAVGAGDEFTLGPEECAVLMREGVQYYHRYVALFHLERYDLVARDTARNLRLFAFVVKHAVRQRDRIEFDRYRPYVAMMHHRARASEALAGGDRSARPAEHVDGGIVAIRQFLVDYGQEDHEGECAELQFLLQWRQDLEREKPIGPLERLEQQLEVSVKLENYEEAARIRDQIRRLKAADPREPRRLGSP